MGRHAGDGVLADQGPAGRAVSVTLSSPLISTPRWLEDTRRLRLTLPKPVQSALNKCEAVETADDPACVAANDVFEEHFVRGAKALPAVPECEGVTGGDQVYRHMWGAGEFTATGLLRDYDRTDRLDELKLPVLFLAGRHDEAAPETIADFQKRVPGAQMRVLEHSAHATYRTETAEYVKIVRQFLAEAERTVRRRRHWRSPRSKRPAPRVQPAGNESTRIAACGCRADRETRSTSRAAAASIATMKVPADEDEVKLMMDGLQSHPGAGGHDDG